MLKTLAFAALLLVAAPAAAQEPITGPAAPPFEPSGLPDPWVVVDLDLISDYRFRGISRSDEDPAVQASVHISHSSGFYGGARATTLRGIDSFRVRDPGFGDLGDVQLDLYAGFAGDLGGGFSADAGLISYLFAGGRGEADHVEPYASLSYEIGPARLEGGARYAPSQSGTGHEDMLYLYGRALVSLPSSPWSFSAELGHQDWGAYGGYWTWSLGGSYSFRIDDLPNTAIGLSYVDTDLPAAPGQDAGLVASLRISF